jgi:hypothetical protein
MLNRATWWLMRVAVPPIVRRVEAHPKAWIAGMFIWACGVMGFVFYTAPRHTDAPSGSNTFHGHLASSVAAAVLIASFAFVLAFTLLRRRDGR